MTKVKNSSIINKKQVQPKSSISECKTYEELDKTLREKYNISLDPKLKKYDFECVKQASQGITGMIDKYPEISENIVSITTTRKKVAACFQSKEKAIAISPEYIKDTDSTNNLLNYEGSYPNLSLSSIGAHEAAHALEYTILRKAPATPFARDIKEEKYYGWASNREARKISQQAIKNIQNTDYGKGKSEKELRTAISVYSNTKYGELFAEAFADFSANGENANPLSIEIVRLGGERYEAVKGNQSYDVY